MPESAAANDLQSGAGGVTVAGLERRLSDLGPEDNVAVSVGVAKPSWMVTRFPVSLSEFEALNQAAQQPAPAAAAAVEADDLVTEDSATDVAEADAAIESDGGELPEDAGSDATSAAPVADISFEATPQTAFRPPDCTMAVGPRDVLVAVNVDLAGFRKDGSLRFRWPSMTALFSGATPNGAGLFDPKLAYDHYAQRWIAIVAARRQSPAGSWIMLAVSQTSDPAGAWWVWALDSGVDGSNPSNNWADYPMLGFDTQAIYITTNQFAFGGGFQYSKLRILNKAEAYSGSALRWWDFWSLRNRNGSLAFTVQSAMHFRGTGGNPPAYFCNALWPSGSTLTLWQLDDPLALWSGRSPSLAAHDVPCRSYDLPPDAEQPGTTTRLETNDSRLLCATYQYVGGRRSVWTAHTSRITWSGESVSRSVLQWYEIDVSTRAVVQQGAYGARGFYYFFPVVQTDIRRNAYLCFSRSSANELGSLRQTGRRVSDTANQLQGSALVKAGESAYLGARWGDYFGHARDGGDSNRVWLYGEFADARGAWGTWVSSSRF